MPVEVSVSFELKESFAIAYSGKNRQDDHSIDVEALAPALLAFGRLIREANAEFNGNRSRAKVLVSSEFEDRCFHIDFDVVLSYYEQIKTLLATESIKTAKDILEWIGLFKDHGLTLISPSGCSLRANGANRKPVFLLRFRQGASQPIFQQS
jgi:hypothetical protein